MAVRDTIERTNFAGIPDLRSKVRGLVFQVVLIVLLALGIWWIVDNTIENLRRSNISTSCLPQGARRLRHFRPADRLQLRFRWTRAGHQQQHGDGGDRRHHRGDYHGFLVGIGRLSNNWLIRKIIPSMSNFSATYRRSSSPVLVSGRAGAAAGCARQLRAALRLVSQQPRFLFRASCGEKGRGWCSRSRRGHRAQRLRGSPRAASGEATGQQFPSSGRASR